MAAKAKEDKAKNEKNKTASAIENANIFFEKWVADGRICTQDGNPKLGKDAAIAIVSVLLPQCDPKEKKGKYKTMKKCNEWLGGLTACGTTWEEELKAISDGSNSGN